MRSNHPFKAALPPEIILSIIDHLHDDPSTLAKSALVGRSWVYRSRYHLFRTLKLRETKDSMGNRFLELLNPPDSARGSPTYSTFQLCVRHVLFDQVVKSNLTEESVPLSHNLIRHLSGRTFCNINTLTIRMGFSAISIPSATLLSSVFLNITSLVLEQLECKEISPVFTTLSAFPALESLNFTVVLPHWRFKHTDNTTSFPHGFLHLVSSQLCFLKLCCFCPQSMYHWFSSAHQELPNLKHLQLTDMYGEELGEYLGPLLSKLGPVLEDLSLSFMDKLPEDNCRSQC